ncbi:MAG: hypothetical protein CL764_02580 [Chloroflexi bacterium]|nr:hypothetical protein [Chloroflexota bacterium]|tara:strand:- start:4705 stop:5649 length:945 start_codon:yes stop_codon:yes gene_type:complete
MKYKFIALLLSIALTIAVWVRHKQEWFEPDPILKNTFWPQHGFGAIFSGFIMGVGLYLLTLLIHNSLLRNDSFLAKNFSTKKVSLVAIILLSTSIISWGFIWQYVENSEIRRNKNTIENFQMSFENFNNSNLIKGDSSDIEKNLIYNFYNSLWNISAAPKESSTNEILNYTTREFGLYMYDIYSLKDSSMWKGFSWGVPTLPCYGPFGLPVRFRIDEANQINEISYKFQSWDPKKGGQFSRLVPTPKNLNYKFIEITRAIAKAVVSNEFVIYDYACWRSEEKTSTEIIVLCNSDGITKVCGITDTAGNWIYKDF